MESKYKKIILAYNGSDNCFSAFKKAAELSKNYEIPLEVVTVTEFINTVALDLSATGLGTYAPIYVEDEYDPNKIVAEKTKDIEEQASKLQINLSNIEILFGEPNQEIIEYLKEEKNQRSLLVLSSSEKKNYEKWILGSVARTLSEKAPIDTLIVRKHEGN